MEENSQLKQSVWEKGQKVDGYNPDMYRKDPCGAWIVWDKYDVKDNIFGWEIDHIYPEAWLLERGFSAEQIDNIQNLRPMQHENKTAKGNDYPSYVAVVTSEGNKNIYKEASLVVNDAIRTLLAKLYQR